MTVTHVKQKVATIACLSLSVGLAFKIFPEFHVFFFLMLFSSMFNLTILCLNI